MLKFAAFGPLLCLRSEVVVPLERFRAVSRPKVVMQCQHLHDVGLLPFDQLMGFVDLRAGSSKDRERGGENNEVRDEQHCDRGVCMETLSSTLPEDVGEVG